MTREEQEEYIRQVDEQVRRELGHHEYAEALDEVREVFWNILRPVLEPVANAMVWAMRKVGLVRHG